MPLGAKADGTLYETADWTVHQMGDNNFDHVVAAVHLQQMSNDKCHFDFFNMKTSKCNQTFFKFYFFQKTTTG